MRTRYVLSTLLGIFLLASAHLAAAAITCVSTDSELSQALSAAALSPEGDIVRIVQGNYNGGFVYASTNDSSLAIEGGYSAACASRVPDPENTILDGGDSARVLSLSSSGSADISLEFITFQNGSGDTSACGGGVLIDTNGNLVSVTDSIFSNNVAGGYGGGGLCVKPNDGDVLIHGNHVNDNRSSGFGTGVLVSSAGIVSVFGNMFIGNIGTTGAGISVRATQEAAITNNDFTANNSYEDLGSGIYTGVNTLLIDGNRIKGGTRGGGLFAGPPKTPADQSWTISNNVILNNAEGSGVRVSRVWTGREVAIVNNIISGNSTQNGNYSGGVSIEGLDASANVILTNNTIVNNYSPGDGGGLKIDEGRNGSSAYLHSNIFWNNLAAGMGSDLFINDDDEGDSQYALVELLNNTFDQSGDGFFIINPAFPAQLSPTNLDGVDPLFVPEIDDYHLGAASPCINTGNNLAPAISSLDQEGKKRILLGVVDMGAYEFPPAGDIILDGSIDLKDLVAGLRLLSGTPSENLTNAGDVNQDEKVGMEEILYNFNKIAE